MGFIYLSKLNITPFNLKMVPVTPVISLKNPKIIESLPVVTLLSKLSLGESLPKSCES